MLRILTLLSILSASAFADELDVQVHAIDGKEYVCFTEADAQALLQIRIDFPKLELKVKNLAELVTVKEQEIVTMTRMLKIRDEQIVSMTEETVALQKQLESLNAWYRSPYLWVGVGLVVGVTTVVLVYNLK